MDNTYININEILDNIILILFKLQNKIDDILYFYDDNNKLYYINIFQIEYLLYYYNNLKINFNINFINYKKNEWINWLHCEY